MKRDRSYAYKPSKYNILVQDKDQHRHFIFNTWSLGLAMVDPDIFILLKKAQTDPKYIDDLRASKPQEFGDLFRGHLIVDNDLNEEKQIWLLYTEARFSNRSLNATIVPTNDCNLACKYCYQTPSSTHMNRTIENKVVTFLKRNSASTNNINITWYGGEPLLAIDTIRHITSELKSHCNKTRKAYRACMVSNGTLLTPDKINLLRELQIQQIQITVDGLQKTHDLRRPYKNSKGSSFKDIFSNIDCILGRVKINLRMNVDISNINESQELMRYLKNNHYLDNSNNLSLSLGYVRPWSHRICSYNAKCLSPTTFSSAWVKFFSRCYDKDDMLSLLPDHATLCRAVSKNSFVIDPTGNLKRCWIDIGHERDDIGNIGDLDRAIDYASPLATQWLSYDPLTNNPKTCGNCAYFPICVGGCPYIQLFKKKMRKDNCKMWETQILEAIKEVSRNVHYYV